jgi:hypothetical protein
VISHAVVHKKEKKMTTNFETELNALLDSSDEKKKQHVEVQKIVRDEAAEFLKEFTETAERVIRPALDEVKAQLVSRGRASRVEADLTGVNHEGKEQAASIAIYFNVSEDKYESRLNEYPYVKFNCNKREKVVQVHESTTGPNHGGHSGSAGTLKLSEVTDGTVKAKVLKALKEIPL